MSTNKTKKYRSSRSESKKIQRLLSPGEQEFVKSALTVFAQLTQDPDAGKDHFAVGQTGYFDSRNR